MNNEELFPGNNVSSNIIDDKRDELDQIREDAPLEVCEDCFSIVNSHFNKQLDLINSIKIYRTNDEKRAEISDEVIVKSVFESLSNKQRLQIIKSMASETRTFSSQSKLTGLRGRIYCFISKSC
jgi:hypothetical protein